MWQFRINLINKPPSKQSQQYKNNRKGRVCSELTIKTLKRRQRRLLSGVFIVYFEQISSLVLTFILLTGKSYNR